MDTISVNNFLHANRDKFPTSDLPYVIATLERLDATQLSMVNSIEFKDPIMFFTLSLAVGWLGLDRFLLGQTRFGLVKLFTLGGCGTLWIIDTFRISADVRLQNIQAFRSLTT